MIDLIMYLWNMSKAHPASSNVAAIGSRPTVDDPGKGCRVPGAVRLPERQGALRRPGRLLPLTPGRVGGFGPRRFRAHGTRPELTGNEF